MRPTRRGLRWFGCLFACLVLVPVQLAQEPERTESLTKPSAEQPRKGGAFPSDAVIVLCENLQQALASVPGGSVVLTAERYQALIEKLMRLELEKGRSPRTLLLGRNQINGKVLTVNPQVSNQGSAPNQFQALLRLALEFRTEKPMTFVPIPLQGARLVKATLDGETPIWGPDAENLSVLVKEPRICTLLLELVVPVTVNGAERKLVMAKVPTAAVMTLSLTVPEKVRSAQVRQGGEVSLRTTSAQESQLTSEALGMLSQLELTWLAELPEQPRPPRQEIMGDIRVTVEKDQTETSAILRCKAREGKVHTTKLRLPPGVQDVRVEQWREDSEGGAEPWNGTLTVSDNSCLLTWPRPLGRDDPVTSLRLRWVQKTPVDSMTTMEVGPPEVIEPVNTTSSGTLHVSLSPDLRARLQPHGLVRTEAPAEAGLGVGAVFAYRYGKPLARLDLLVDPAPGLPALADVQVTHQVRITEQALHLSTDVEVLRTARLNVQEMELSWPRTWLLSRGVLLAPHVEAVEHDPASGVARVRFTGRLTGPFKFKLTGRLPLAGQAQADLLLPQVVHIRGENNGRTETAQLLVRDGQVQIEAENLEARLEPETSGVVGKSPSTLDFPLLLRGLTVLHCPAAVENSAPPAPAKLRLSWLKRRPLASTRVEVYVHAETLQVRQHFLFAARQSIPSPLEFSLDRALLRTLHLSVTGTNQEGKSVCLPLPFRERNVGQDDKAEISCTVPAILNGEITIHGEYSQPCHQTNVLLALLQPRATQLAIVEPIAVRCWAGANLQLSLQGTGWLPGRFAQDASLPVPPTLELQGTDLDKPLHLTLTPVADDFLPEIHAERMLVEVRPLANSLLAYRVRLRLAQVRGPWLRLLLGAAAEDVFMENVYSQGRSVPKEQWRLTSRSETQTCLALPVQPRWLSQPLLVDLRFQVRAPARWWALRQDAPGLSLEGRVRQASTRWRWESPQAELLVGHSAAFCPEQQGHWYGWIVPPTPEMLGPTMSRWLSVHETTLAGEEPAYSFTQTAPLGTLTVFVVPPMLWCGMGSLLVLLLGWLAWQRIVPSRWLWGSCATVFLILFAFGSATLFWAVAYAVQPGLLVLLGLITAHWVRQQQWRRQIVMLPGFTRLPDGMIPVPSVAARVVKEPVDIGQST